MRRFWLTAAVLTVLGMNGLAYAYKTVVNPFTGKPDFVGANAADIGSGTLGASVIASSVSASAIQTAVTATDSSITVTKTANGVSLASVGGSGSSTLAISTGGVIVTTPTVRVDFDSNTFVGASGSVNVASITMNTSSVTLQGNAFNAANKLLKLDASAFVPAAQIPAFTGDVTSAGGALALTIAANVVTAAKMANNTITNSQIASGTFGNITGIGTQTQALNMNSHLINNVTEPVSSQDAATKNYVDASINGLDWKAAAMFATTVALPTNAYLNGSSGVGATLTGTSLGTFAIDGYTPAVGQRILVKNEAAAANNGIYTVTTNGAGAFYVLTRATDYNQTSEIQAGDAVFVTSGTANKDSSWIMTTDGTITVGTTAINWSQFAASYSAGGGLLLTGTQFSVDSTSGTLQGNTFNTASKLVQLNASTQYPALDGSLINKVSSLTVVATAGTYGSTTIIPTITINAQGQVISLSSNTAAAGASGPFTQAVSSTNLSMGGFTFSNYGAEGWYIAPSSTSFGPVNLTLPANSTTTICQVSNLVINSTYAFHAYVRFSGGGSASAGVKYQFVTPAGSTVSWALGAPNNGATTARLDQGADGSGVDNPNAISVYNSQTTNEHIIAGYVTTDSSHTGTIQMNIVRQGAASTMSVDLAWLQVTRAAPLP